MRNTPYLAAAASAALLTLAGCNSDPKSSTPSNRGRASPTQLKAAAAAVDHGQQDLSLHPTTASIYVDFYSNNRAAVRHGTRTATPTMLTAARRRPPSPARACR